MKKIRFLSILLLTAFLFGCASGARMDGMVYTPSVPKTYDEALKNQVGVKSVTGGQKTNPAWTSEISSESFSDAVKNSLSQQGLLAEKGRYQLQVNMLKVDQPLFGLDLTVTTHVRYILTDTKDDAIVLDETIVAPHTATIDDAFAAVKRLRLANEGSGKKNIEGLIDKLSKLKIKPQQVSVVN
ncbi:MAG TPA: hypothetical protein VGK97_06450 [Spongiibacteraceae bacterium]|jgi:hypothetical protein